ncbi:hypothetical protein [Epilithonimonas zeae]|uniref:hypothetical protein n=1 Tax=Epilithonimonas zeae TaxID=1416779 RepID=UPI00200E6A1B|nr:hypothetical protein [Epilithonimonas zeae]UQB68100.1 hypothetical protein KI430_13830 [Epilithonimonas zeae]
MRKINLFLFFIICNVVFAQDLDTYRLNYCLKKCKIYSKELIDKKNKNDAVPSYMIGTPKFSKMFSIKEDDRMKIYPFNKYDSIYVTNPILIEKIQEPRNYLDKKYHKSLRLLSKDEKNKLSDILFNYHKTYDLFRISVKGQIGCDCVYLEYPQMILLFMKNGRFEKYIAFPDDGWDRYNFSDGQYNNFDWSENKESMILDMFKKDILPDQNCKTPVYNPPPPEKK